MSYTKSHYHIVFRTYQSEKTISEEHERELYAYIFGIAKNLDCQTYRIGGMPDHIHIFVSLPSTISLASFVQRVKTDSSKWLKVNPHFPDFRGWGHEYGGFSYNFRDKDKIINYIIRQKEHHQQTTFAEEYRSFIEENGIEIDERYFLRDSKLRAFGTRVPATHRHPIQHSCKGLLGYRAYGTAPRTTRVHDREVAPPLRAYGTLFQ